MKFCLSCKRPFSRIDWICPNCGASPFWFKEFPAFTAPSAGDGFHPDFFSELAELEGGHFWFEARNRLVIHFLRRHSPTMNNFLEVGCGTGYVLSGIAEAFPSLQLFGCEYFGEGLPFAARRVPGASLFQVDARALPFFEEFDGIGAFDVLEHIAEDQDVLGQFYQALRPGGGLLLTVPQHPWLWSATDVQACHLRRYRVDELCDRVRTAGFNVRYTTSFVSLLLPFMLFSRFSKPTCQSNVQVCSELRINPVLNRFFSCVMSFEYLLLRSGLRLPVGGSLVIVGVKPKD